jgi:trigger factor
MNITKELKDELNAVLKVQISKDDYEPRIQKVLNDYRKKARIDGFRPGKVPAGLINKMYGKSVMVDEINKMLSESLMKYIEDEKLHILGDPLPSQSEQKPIDWDNDSTLEFAFDLGLSPQFDVKLSKKDKLVSYAIKPDSKLIETYSDNYARRYGSFTVCDCVADGKEMVKGSFIEVNADGTDKADAHAVAESTIYIEFMKDEDIKKQFMGAKSGDSIVLNVRKAYPNDVELASILHVKKEDAANINSEYRITIASISKFDKAPINQELFDKIYGEGVVTSEAEFQAKIEEEIKANLSRESEYKFRIDTKEAMLNKINFALPVDFLKRWLVASNEGKFTAEQVEAEFEKYEREFKWQLIKSKIVKDNNLQVTEEEILDLAKMTTRMQFEQYGLFNVPEEHIVSYAEESLKRSEDRQRMFERKFEDKVLEFAKATMTVDEKEVSAEEFDKLLEENNQ